MVTSPPPLSARSVVISLMLGSHPDPMTARQVVAAGEHLGLPAVTVRVALTRGVAAGDLDRTGSAYRLGPRLLARRAQQEVYRVDTAWDGSWQMAVVTTVGRPGRERAALRTALGAARLAELREGVRMRPANLSGSGSVGEAEQVTCFTGVRAEDPVGLAAALWDLDGWAAEARAVMALLATTADPAERLAVAARLVRHLATDMLLPTQLWPEDWPATAAREVSAAYEQEIRAISRR